MGRSLCVLVSLTACGSPYADWTWTPVEKAVCADGSSTGFGIKSGSGDDLVIYLMGGGACWDATTCYAAQTAWHIVGGFDEGTFRREPYRDVLDVFPDATKVFVPYCTGDVHSGTATREYVSGRPLHHAGALNLDAFLARIAAPKGRVFVVGTSAGGFGAQFNAARFVDAFEGHEVHVVADSAAMVIPEDKLNAWKVVWGATDRSALPPSSRLGLVSSQHDLVISAFAGLGYDAFNQRLDALVDAQYRTANRGAFIVDGSQHVFFDHLWTDHLKSWLEAFRDGTGDFRTNP
jgi:hypothetical protein